LRSGCSQSAQIARKRLRGNNGILNRAVDLDNQRVHSTDRPGGTLCYTEDGKSVRRNSIEGVDRAACLHRRTRRGIEIYGVVTAVALEFCALGNQGVHQARGGSCGARRKRRGSVAIARRRALFPLTREKGTRRKRRGVRHLRHEKERMVEGGVDSIDVPIVVVFCCPRAHGTPCARSVRDGHGRSNFLAAVLTADEPWGSRRELSNRGQSDGKVVPIIKICSRLEGDAAVEIVVDRFEERRRRRGWR